MDTPETEIELDPEIERIIGQISDRLARRFTWEMRLQLWTHVALAGSAVLASLIVSHFFILSSLTRQATTAIALIERTLS